MHPHNKFFALKGTVMCALQWRELLKALTLAARTLQILNIETKQRSSHTSYRVLEVSDRYHVTDTVVYHRSISYQTSAPQKFLMGMRH